MTYFIHKSVDVSLKNTFVDLRGGQFEGQSQMKNLSLSNATFLPKDGNAISLESFSTDGDCTFPKKLGDLTNLSTLK